MSIVVNINPHKKKKIDFKLLNQMAYSKELYIGTFDDAYRYERYTGKNDIRNVPFILFYKKLFGRGFSFLVDDDYNAELTLNYPCSVIDIAIFYKFITMYCKYFNLDKFTQEGEVYSLDDIEKLQVEADDFNKRIVCKELKVGLTIFGCIYPIVIDDDLVLKLRSNEEDKAYNYFAKYLDNLQRPMYYYAIPLIYKNNNKYIAKYGLTKDVPSIFPKSTYLPFGYNQKLLDNITSWSVAVIENQEYSITCEIPYNDFCKLININKLPKFDYKHKLVTIDNKIMAKISKYKIEKAKDELSNWLSDYRELGHKPSKIEYTNEFVTENIHCYIFKYKKERFSKWYLGIVSDSGTFSEFKEYKKETEIDDAKEIIKLLSEFWKKTAENIDK